ncbi:DUF2087 domain-containing protein [Piscinibacter sp. XHJ-5]|uniref:DUF2087 domain-containing protein n=1 Tax=Piscinibacter sp. XHJ-5 TaxID=3037797 RepID=UPI00245366DA|nr:DUF2087 domain-containing protein [Piscinibacter sp. XHJ-5]
MPRHPVPLHADDISSFAKALGRQLTTAHEREPRPPCHVELLNMLARAAGHRNFQSLRARPPAVVPQAAPAALGDIAVKALRQFDDVGRLVRWPTKHSVQRMMLWGLWMRFDSRRKYSERQVNELLNAWHLFGDHCTLRRELVTMRLLERKSDGSAYRKLPARPDPQTMAMLRALRARS